MKNIGEMNAFFKGKRILIVDGHEWEGEETDFVTMVLNDGTVPKDSDPPNVNLRMRVITRFKTTFDLEQKHAFVIINKTTINPNQN